ncbi:hypothetical protein ES705_37782 [subsurface metagenome]
MSREYTRRIAIVGNVPAHGPIIYYDDFEDLLKWSKLGGEGDSIFELDPTDAFSKNQSLYMKTRTASAAEDDLIGAYRYLYMLPSKKPNQAIHFKALTFTTIKHLIFRFILYDGVNQHSAGVRFVPGTPTWQYKATDLSWPAIPDSGYPLAINTWHRIQLQIDLNTNKYLSLIVGHRHLDLSAFQYFFDPDTTDSHMYNIIEIETIGAAPCELRIDDFLLHEL